MEPIRHVLVALDFHGPSLRGLDYAARLARGVGAKLTLFHACDMPAQGLTADLDPVKLRGELRELATRELQTLVDAVRAEGTQAEFAAVEDVAPADAILDAARELEADILVLGTHGRKGIARLALGSVAEQVLRRSSLPVVTLHQWRFENRREAAMRLAKKVAAIAEDVDLTVALTRGAVPIAIDLARLSKTRVETFLVEPIAARDGAPIGAAAEDGTTLVKDELAEPHIAEDAVLRAIEEARASVRQHARWLRAEPLGEITGFRVLLVADALLTRASAHLAARAMRMLGAKHVSLAVPVCSARIANGLAPDVDRVICVETTHFEPPTARVYREEQEPTNVDAAEMLVRAGASRMGAQAH